MSDAPVGYGNPTDSGRDTLGRFSAGNKARPHDTSSKRRRMAMEMFDQFGFDPLENKIRLAISLRTKIMRNHFAETSEKLEYLKIYGDVLKDLLQYGYQRLKAVEHFGQIELVHKLQQLDTCSDDELAALLAEAEELARATPVS
jgi:hypothetical protein